MPKGHEKKGAAKAVRIAGTVEGFNLSPRGEIEGLLVATATGLTQVNLEKGAAVPGGWTAGAAVVVDGVPESAHGEHPVFALVSAAENAVEGKVARINFTRHGEPNGFVLEDGTFVHLRPEGARRFGKVAVGDRIRAAGDARTGSRARVIDTDRIDHEPARRAARRGRAAAV